MRIEIDAFDRPEHLELLSEMMAKLAKVAKVPQPPEVEVVEQPDTNPPTDEVKLTGRQHKVEADKMITAGKITDRQVYEALTDAQRKRVDDALNASKSGPTGDSAELDDKSLRDTLRALLTKIAETKDPARNNAMRAYFTEVLTAQGTEFDKPKQSLVETANLPAAITKAEEVLGVVEEEEESEDNDNPFD